MKTNSIEIKSILNNLWPGIRIMCADRDYWLPSEKDLKDIIWKSYIDEYQYAIERFDCDDFALVLHAFIVQERYIRADEHKLPKEEWFPWAFGEVWGSKFQGENTAHAINICITDEEEIFLIEPQNDKIWLANSSDDNVYFCRM